MSYKEAKEALEAADGSVVDAIIDIEESIGEKTKGRVSENGYKVVQKIKDLVKKGNVSKIVIKKEEEVVLNLPVNIGIVGTVIAPWAMIIGVLAAFGTKCVIELVKDDGSIIEVSEFANDTFEDVVEKGSIIAGEMKNKGVDVYKSVINKTSDVINKSKRDKDVDFCFDDAEDEDDCGEEDHENTNY